MNIRQFLTPALALIWAGFCIGGALIAVPAKFWAASLTLPVALDVGRAQFMWIGAAETALVVLFVLSVVAFGGIARRWALIPVALFLVQWLVIMPPLDARTLQIIAGENLPESQLHFVYVGVEVLKLLSLVTLAWISVARPAPAAHRLVTE